MDDKGNMAIGIGAMLLLVNVLVGVTGVVDGLIESNVEAAVAEGYDGLDENGEQNYSADYDDEWLVSTAERVYFCLLYTSPSPRDRG